MFAKNTVKKGLLITTFSGLAAFTLVAPTAYGFFPPVGTEQTKVAVIKPPVVTPPTKQVVPPIPPVCPPPTTPTTCHCTPGGGGNGTQTTPEPGTLIAVGVGLATVAATRLRKKQITT
jgi:hypothetical protein